MNDRPEDKEVQEIPVGDLFTPAEHDLIVSTPEPGDWPVNIPIAVTKGEPIELVAEQRTRKLAQFLSTDRGFALGYGRSLVIQFPDLDPVTGETIGEPKFIGLWDDEKRRVEMAENPEEFDREVKERLAEFRERFEKRSD